MATGVLDPWMSKRTLHSTSCLWPQQFLGGRKTQEELRTGPWAGLRGGMGGGPPPPPPPHIWLLHTFPRVVGELLLSTERGPGKLSRVGRKGRPYPWFTFP